MLLIWHLLTLSQCLWRKLFHKSFAEKRSPRVSIPLRKIRDEAISSKYDVIAIPPMAKTISHQNTPIGIRVSIMMGAVSGK
jgi:hypothetical protein|tara:strand:- start:3 stop:245 length:243 start_codon:yes stop_codon:yes gene_type:complete